MESTEDRAYPRRKQATRRIIVVERILYKKLASIVEEKGALSDRHCEAKGWHDHEGHRRRKEHIKFR